MSATASSAWMFKAVKTGRNDSSSGTLVTSAKATAPPFETQSVCSVMMSLTMLVTSDCLIPGAQYSIAADGGFPGVISPETQRLAPQCLPMSLTDVNNTPLTFDW